MFKDDDAKLATLTDAQLGWDRGSLQYPFLKTAESALILEKKPRVHVWVIFSIQNVVLDYLGEKAQKIV